MYISQLVRELNNIEKAFQIDSPEDTIIHLNDNHKISVHAPTLGKESYYQMEQDISDFSIEGQGYTVYVWNDSSGWEYWNKEGEHYTGQNYIQVSAHIQRAKDVDVNKLANDMLDAYNKFEQYDTMDSLDCEKYQ